MPAARTSRSANPSPTVDKTHRMRGSGGSGDQIALKDGKHLLVVQYIWHGPFRASAMRRTKMAADPAASGGFAVVALARASDVDRRCRGVCVRPVCCWLVLVASPPRAELCIVVPSLSEEVRAGCRSRAKRELLTGISPFANTTSERVRGRKR